MSWPISQLHLPCPNSTMPIARQSAAEPMNEAYTIFRAWFLNAHRYAMEIMTPTICAVSSSHCRLDG